MRVLNFGSLNIDFVYRMPRIVAPGETLSCRALHVFAGGKGANQSVALAKAGAQVFHAGLVGHDGRWLIERLGELGVDVANVRVSREGRTGNAIIQVSDEGENAIVLYPGTNHELTRPQIDETLARFGDGDVLLLQNETNEVPYLIAEAKRRDMRVVFNPAPMTPAVRGYPLADVDVLFVNETEGRELTGRRTEDEVLAELPAWENVLTLGGTGVRFSGNEELYVPGVKVDVVDTTAAGDTFIGYFLAARGEGKPNREALELACRAAAMCCTKLGAMDAIPSRAEVEAFKP